MFSLTGLLLCANRKLLFPWKAPHTIGLDLKRLKPLLYCAVS